MDPCHAQWAGFLHDLWCRDEPGVRTVLDLCCGTGLLAAELVRLGYQVVGVDAAPAMLERARRLLGPDVVLVEARLPHLPVDGVFDAVVSTFDGFNYLTPDELAQTLEASAARLRPGGWLVFDLHTDAMMAFTAANPVVEGEADGQRFVISSVVDVAARTCDTRIDVERQSDGDVFTERHRQYFFADSQVEAALGHAGFELVAVTDEYTHRPVDEETLRATWVNRRPGRDPRSRGEQAKVRGAPHGGLGQRAVRQGHADGPAVAGQRDTRHPREPGQRQHDLTGGQRGLSRRGPGILPHQVHEREAVGQVRQLEGETWR